MAIFIEVARAEVPLGVGGRITVPHEIRESMGLTEGDVLHLRVEETRSRSGSRRQLVLWAKKRPALSFSDDDLE